MNSKQKALPALSRRHPDRGRQVTRAATAWGALVLYLFLATPLAPALTALAAAVDVDHHVRISLGATGPQVILHHEWPNAPQHHHGPVARALDIFARGEAPGHSDHVIQFSSVRFVEAARREALANPAEANPAAPPGSEELPLELAAAPACFTSITPPAPPEQSAPPALVVARTTVLLI